MYDEVPTPDLTHYPPASCVDAAYERQAILEGWKFKTVFPENKQLYDDMQTNNTSRPER